VAPTFRRLAWVQLAHAGADAGVAVALADTLFFAVPTGDARDKVALYLGVTMAPFALLSPLVGPFLDRWRGAYRMGIVAASCGRAVLTGFLASRTGGAELYPLAFGLLVLSRVHGVSRSALVPEVLLPGRRLVGANAWLAVVSVVGAALGAGAAAGSNRLGGREWTLWGTAAVFAVATVPALRLPGARPDADSDSPVQRDWRALLSARLVAGGVAMAATRAAVGFATFLFIFVLRAEGEGVGGYSLVLGAAGVGGFAGSALAPALRRILPESLILLASPVAMGTSALWAGSGYRLGSAAVVGAVAGLSSAIARLAFDSLVQQEAPGTIRGRTFARYETVFQLGWVGGAGLATAVQFTAPAGFRTMATICFTGVLLSIRGLRRSRRAGTRPGRQEARW
jgi:hypothetical protein